MTLLFDLLKEIVAAWKQGGKQMRIAIALAGCLVAAGGLTAFLSDIFWGRYLSRRTDRLGTAIAALGGAVAVVIYFIQRAKEEVKREEKIEAVERRVQENPGETQAAWELARVKLESYLNRNLAQVRSIFWLTLVVMTAGFILIGFGVYQAFHDAASFKASLLTTASGVIVSFIGSTFLVLYKATMAQAKDYVTILERINAVGMSVQILDTIDAQATALKHQTTADVARQLLAMYSTDNVTHNTRIQ